MARKRRTSKRRAPVRRSRKKSGAKDVAAFVLGGATGAMVGGMLVRSGVKPTTAAVGVTVAGAAAALGLRKGAQLAAGGAAAAGAGQLALTWLASQADKSGEQSAKVIVKKNGAKQPRQGLPDIDAAFDRAREQIAMEDEAAAFTDGYDDEEVITVN